MKLPAKSYSSNTHPACILGIFFLQISKFLPGQSELFFVKTHKINDLKSFFRGLQKSRFREKPNS
jgi:hypothetical protein